MTEQKIEPHKVTKPIQLLAAWLVGLVLTNTLFLVSAINLGSGGWERSALVVAAIVNVPVLLLALFILQTKFRAELQEDTYYAEYLSKKTATLVRIDKNATQDSKLAELELKILRITESNQPLPASTHEVDRDVLDWSSWPIALNRNHPRFAEIRKALRNAGIPLATLFGTPGGKSVPSKWIIAVSRYLPIAHKVQLLRMVLPFGFDGFVFWEPQREAEEMEDVYIGSYGIDEYSPVTDQLMELLNGDIEMADLTDYCQQHQIKATSIN